MADERPSGSGGSYERGVWDARMEARTSALERADQEREQDMTALKSTVEELSRSVRDLSANVEQKEAVDRALHDAVQRNTNRQISARQFYVGVCGLIVAFGGMTIGIIESVH